jgi:hypothetical protein
LVIHQENILYSGWKLLLVIMWKGFEDKVTHPQYNGDVKNGTRIVKEL